MSRSRSWARQRATQAIYQWQMTGQNVSDIDAQFLSTHDMSNVDLEYFKELLHGIPAHLGELDGHVSPLLDRPIDQVDPVERAILRVGSYELCFRPEIPYRVIINEAVELAKTFGAEQGHKYVNSILDKIAQNVRKAEVAARAKK